MTTQHQQPSPTQQADTGTGRQRVQPRERSAMGSFFSTLVTPPPPAADDPNCAVVAAHSKATYDEQWAAHKSSSKLMVIDFSASWCGPCRFIEPAFKELASRFTDAIFVKVDVDELAEVARTWKVEAMPTFVLVKDGKEVGRVIGAKKDELERKIRMFVTSSSSS